MPAVSNLKKVQQAIHKGVQEGYQELAARLVELVKENTPVHSGELRDSVISKIDAELIIGATAEHAPHVELGTSLQEAQPFLEPTVTGELKLIQDTLQKNVNEVTGI